MTIHQWDSRAQRAAERSKMSTPVRKPVIRPALTRADFGCTGTLRITGKAIADVLGFEPNILNEDTGPSPDGKVTQEWAFTVDGILCGIWDYKGSTSFGEYSVGGPALVWERLFPNEFKPNNF